MSAKQIPMLFSAPMVRALLEGRKTQTRRLKFTGQVGAVIWVRETWRYHDWSEDGQPWVCYRADDAKIFHSEIGEDSSGAPLDKWERLSDPANFGIDNRAADRKWRTAIHMPRWASRIQLRVTSLRKERLQDISERDCWAEGIEEVLHDFDDIAQIDMAKRLGCCVEDAKPLFAMLWESIHGPKSWDENPELFVIGLERIKSETPKNSNRDFTPEEIKLFYGL